MADFETTARPYARAVFELASDEGALEQWSDLLASAAVIAADDDMQTVFATPAILAHQRAELFLSVVDDAKITVDDHFKNLIKLLAENGRLAALPSIASIFDRLKQAAEGKIEVLVRSAQTLSDAEQGKIAESMAKRLGKEVKLTTEVDELLIAGAIISAGDLVIDGSARGRMEKLTLAVNK